MNNETTNPSIEAVPLEDPMIEAVTSVEDGKPGREAAKYRRQLREAEAERDALRERMRAEGHAAVDRAAAEHIPGTPLHGSTFRPRVALVDPTDLARYTDGGRDSLLDEAGNVDQRKVAAALEALQTDRPYLFKAAASTGSRDPFAGRIASAPSGGAFAAAFAPTE